MSTYIMSDIHGHYEAYLEMLQKIHFSDNDMLYILGDVIDRGPEPVKILLDLMERANVVPIAGNHCVMACDCLRTLLQDITEDNLSAMDEDALHKLLDWQRNGAATTLAGFRGCDKATQRELAEFMEDFELYEEIMVGDKTYVLVHGGLGNFAPDKSLWDYTLDELVWTRPDYQKPYYPDRYVITGHTPTLLIRENPRPGYIYQANHHIAIDCGCSFPGGRLGCLRLEDMQEFYVEPRQNLD